MQRSVRPLETGGTKAPPLPVVGDILAGRYELKALKSRGSFGAVFSAHDSFLGEQVALKVLVPRFEPQDGNAFKQALSDLRAEARASVQLSHRHVARVFNYERDASGWEFLVMEYIAGGNLKELQRKAAARRLPVSAVVEVGRQVGDALDYAHQKGVLHLDVKPANILRTRNGQFKLCDFGLSALTALLPHTPEGAAFGTFGYMSPEVLRGPGEVDHRSDVYSLAATLYDICTGQPPFGHGFGAVNGHLHEPIPDSPLVPAPLMAVLRRGLAKDLGSRFQTAAAFRDAWNAAAATPEVIDSEATGGGAMDRMEVRPMGRARTSVALETTPRRNTAITTHLVWDGRSGQWSAPLGREDGERTLVVAFCAHPIDGDPRTPLQQLAAAYPRSAVIGCSSSGEIHGDEVRDGSISALAIQFERTQLRTARTTVTDRSLSGVAGERIGRSLDAEDLRAVFVLLGGLEVNASDFLRGLSSNLRSGVVVTGGLAGDLERFERTWVHLGADVDAAGVVAVGLYGDHVLIGHDAMGGWDTFGPQRLVTRAEGNVVREIDGSPALDVYSRYLGEDAENLPASGLLYPLAVTPSGGQSEVLVRTLLQIDREARTLIFAGDVPQGAKVQLMKADFDRLIVGAETSARTAMSMLGALDGPVGALVVSCMGRRSLLDDRTEDELEAVRRMLPPGSAMAGFYSYGELAQLRTGPRPCVLQNQSINLTIFAETAEPTAREPRVPFHASESESSSHPPTRSVDDGASLGGSLGGSLGDDTLAGEELDASVVAGASLEPILDADLPLEPTPPDGPEVANERPRPGGTTQVARFSYDLDARRWSVGSFPDLDSPSTIVFVFGAPEAREDPAPIKALQRAFPRSELVGCSGAGEIHGTEVRDRSLAVVVVRFARTHIRRATVPVADSSKSFSAGHAIGKMLMDPELRWVFVLSEGLHVNGSELVRGLNSVLPERVVCTGGLAGDGDRFEHTWVLNGGEYEEDGVVAIGLYGEDLVVGHGSLGGWDAFGPERLVTRSEGNVVYELDGAPALSLYEQLLGADAAGLPATGLLFPLAVTEPGRDSRTLVRTLLAIDRAHKSITFAGDIPAGSTVRVMKAEFDRLVEGASGAAGTAAASIGDLAAPVVAIAISCVGRRLLLGERTEDELEAVHDLLPPNTEIAGFYSYGEISPLVENTRCNLHNQTMTLTVFGERTRTTQDRPRPVDEAAGSAEPRRASPVVPAEPQATVAVTGAEWPLAAPHATADTDLRVLANRAREEPARSARMTSNTGRANLVMESPPRLDAPRALTGYGVEAYLCRGEPVSVIGISGDVDGRFAGRRFAGRLPPVVVFDLHRLGRVTSSGARKWLAMVEAATTSELYFARVPESMVRQMNLVRGLAGEGTIVSMYAPAKCKWCAHGFGLLLDTDKHRPVIGALVEFQTPCPSCGREAELDEDASGYFGLARGHIGREVPEGVRAVARALSDEPSIASDNQPVDKAFENEATVIRVRSGLDASIPWGAAMDGIDDGLVLDLGGVQEWTASGVAALAAALSEARGIRRVTLRDGPDVLRDELVRALPEAVPLDASAPAQIGGPPRATPVSTEASAASPPTATVAAPPSTPRAWGPLVVAVLALSVAAWAAWGRSPAPPRPDAPTSTAAAPTPRPAWTDVRWEHADGRVFVTGVGLAPTRQAAFEAARSDALATFAVRAVAQTRGSLPHDALRLGGVTDDALAPRARERAARYVASTPALAAPRRTDEFIETETIGARAFVRFELSDAQLEAWSAYFSRTVEMAGITVATVPPSHLEGEAESGVVVVAVSEEARARGVDLRVGDRIVRVDGEPCGDLEALDGIGARAASKVQAGGVVRLEAVVQGRGVEIELGGRG